MNFDFRQMHLNPGQELAQRLLRFTSALWLRLARLGVQLVEGFTPLESRAVLSLHSQMLAHDTVAIASFVWVVSNLAGSFRLKLSDVLSGVLCFREPSAWSLED